MQKPASLRTALVAAHSEFAAHPDMLQIFVTGGSIRARLGKSLSFEYHYHIELILINFKGDANLIFVTVLAWLEENQPDTFLHMSETDQMQFEAEHVDNETVDLSIKIRLSEAVRVKIDHNGQQQIYYLPNVTNDPESMLGGQP